MKIDSNNYFIDTNILIYHTVKSLGYFETVLPIINKLINQEINGFISIQIINEYFSLLTNPKRISETLSIEYTIDNINQYMDFLTLIPSITNYSLLLEKIKEYNIKNRQIFDLNIYLTMLENKIKKIITFNEKDFKIFNNIEIVNPQSPFLHHWIIFE